MTKSPKHTYEYEVELGADTAPARVIRMIGRNRRVLEVGAGPGSITKHLVRSNNCDVVALEIDPAAIAKLREFCPAIYAQDLNDPAWTQALAKEGKFDVVLAADVLEHVSDPGRTLFGMKSLLKDDGDIVLSLPHVGHCVINACLLDEDFDYRNWGLLDRTHVRFFGLKNINVLHSNAGLSIVDAEFVVRPPEMTEFADRWLKLAPEVRAALSSNRYGYVYQVVSRARPSAIAERNLDLMTMPGTVRPVAGLKLVGGDWAHPSLASPRSGINSAVRASLRERLSPQARDRLRSMARRMGLLV